MSEPRSKILTAASELFLTGGSAALSVRAISKRAGLSTIGIYSHFNGKQGILDTLYIEGFDLVYQAMSVDHVSDDAREKMRRATIGYMQVAENNGAHYKLIFGASDPNYKPSDEAVESSKRAFKKLIELVSLFLNEDASFKEKQVNALEFWAIVHGYASLRSHTVAESMDINNWNQLALDAVEKHLESIL